MHTFPVNCACGFTKHNVVTSLVPSGFPRFRGMACFRGLSGEGHFKLDAIYLYTQFPKHPLYTIRKIKKKHQNNKKQKDMMKLGI